MSLSVIEDITDDLEGGSVGRDSYATLHGSATIQVARDLDWGTAIIRPYMTMTDNIYTARFNLGAYLTSSPETNPVATPITHDVQGYDILHWLNTPVGEAYTVAAGRGYLDAAEDVLQAQGILAYRIDQAQASKTLPTAKVWALDPRTTWLNVVNDLLLAIGYQGLWSDWDGALQMTPYVSPTNRATEWLYTTDPNTSMLANERKMIRDWFDAPNRWVFYWSKDPSTAAPVEGAGVYTFVNERNGPTSVQARGRVITAAPVQIDAVDQSALIAAAQLTIDADLRLKTVFEVSTFPNPLHWHFDRVTLNDPSMHPLADVVVSKWNLPLKPVGDDMKQTWSLL